MLKEKWVIIEHKNQENPLQHSQYGLHRVSMTVELIVHIQGKGLLNVNTGDIYKCAFENRQFKTKEEAIKKLANYFKDELNAVNSMFKCIHSFKEQYPELMI